MVFVSTSPVFYVEKSLFFIIKYSFILEEGTATHVAKEVLSYREALYDGFEKMRAQKILLLTNLMVEIVQIVKQNKSGIRSTPGTALKSAIYGVFKWKKYAFFSKLPFIIEKNRQKDLLFSLCWKKIADISILLEKNRLF
ncbi:hypothetical protein [Chitinophaga sp. MM2321]|uniref:hypothetical protein n=1 Tax=Chitinophaga sp. MM2321 TaxID=3137178 RepID=UPI0032D595AC